MKRTITTIATGSAICGALILSGATSAQAARPDDRGPQAPVTATVALHNSTAEIGSDCPDSTNKWWHFVVAPNNDRYSIDEMTLNLGTSTFVATGGDIVGNGQQVDNVFVKVPASSSLDALTTAGSSAEVTGPDSNARLMLSHLCVGTDNDGADEEITEDEITDEEIIDDEPGDDEPGDDEPGDDERPADDEVVTDIDDDTTDDEAIDDEPGNDEITDDEITEEDPGADERPADDEAKDEIVDELEDDVVEDQPTNDIVAEELPSTDTPVIDDTPVTDTPADDTPVDNTPVEETPAARTPAPIVPAEVTADVPAPEMPMLQPATTVTPAITPADTTTEAPARVVARTDAPASSSNARSTDSLPTTGASLLLTPALILIGVGAAARRAAARRR